MVAPEFCCAASPLLKAGSSMFMSRLLLIAPLGIRVDDEMLGSGLKDFCAFLERIPSLHTLELLPGASLPARTWKRIAAAPCTLQLRVVQLSETGSIDPETVRMLCTQLVHFHTLDIAPTLSDSKTYASLALAPELTSLRLRDSRVSNSMPLVQRMDKLLRLTICEPVFLNFKAMWRSDCFAQLVHLSLECARFDAAPDVPTFALMCGAYEASAGDHSADFATWMRSMLSLRSLDLSDFAQVDTLLPHLSLAPSLVHCTIRSGPAFGSWAESSSPSFGPLVQALRAARNLSISLVCVRAFEAQVIGSKDTVLHQLVQRIPDPSISARIDARIHTRPRPGIFNEDSSPELSPREE